MELYFELKGDLEGKNEWGGSRNDLRTGGDDLCIPAGVKLKETVTFGHYPQTASGKDNTPIEWIILKKENGRALLLSRYALDSKRYNETYAGVTWETCTLRSWLNNEFINRAFNERERGNIQVTEVYNPDSYWGQTGDGEWYGNNTGGIADRMVRYYGGRNTMDKVFLLSLNEARALLGNQIRTLKDTDGDLYTGYPHLQAACTDYAHARGAYRSSYFVTFSGEACCWWWLRSPGLKGNYGASDIDCDGRVDDSLDRCVSDSFLAVRPALWVSVKSVNGDGSDRQLLSHRVSIRTVPADTLATGKNVVSENRPC